MRACCFFQEGEGAPAVEVAGAAEGVSAGGSGRRLRGGLALGGGELLLLRLLRSGELRIERGQVGGGGGDLGHGIRELGGEPGVEFIDRAGDLEGEGLGFLLAFRGEDNRGRHAVGVVEEHADSVRGSEGGKCFDHGVVENC